jgi:nucleoside-diphosphate-sugar epimerase
MCAPAGRVKTEQDPLDPNPPREVRQTIDAIRRLEQMVAGAGNLTGIVLRYGSFYGPGTSLGEGGDFLEMIRRRKLPIFGNGAGIWSFVHIDDAANVTRRAIEQGPAGVYNVVDDEPAEVAAWLPGLSQILGVKPPHRLPCGWASFSPARWVSRS